MLKLLFSTAMIAPVLAFAWKGALAEGDIIPEPAITSTPRTATLSAGPIPEGFDAEALPATCSGETLPVVFHGSLMESHSARAIGEAFAERPGCEVQFVRLTSLVPEDADEVDMAGANARRAEVAAHIEALVGKAAAEEMPMRSDTQTAAAERPIRNHAILRIERRPVPDALVVVNDRAGAAGRTATLN